MRKAGAFPLVSFSSDRMARRLYEDVPEKYDAQTPALGLKLAEIVHATISVDTNLSEGMFADANPRRMAARAQAGSVVGQAVQKRNVRSVEVGNGLYPTDWRANRYGVSEDDLAKTFWEGVNVDYSALQSRGEQIKSVLAAANEVHIAHKS